MFWGLTLEPGKKFDLRNLSNCGEILRISKVLVKNHQRKGKSEVFLKFEDRLCLVARVGLDIWEKNIELFVNLGQNIEVHCVGDREVCVVGYIEPIEKRKESEDVTSEEINADHDLEEDEEEEVIIPPKRK